MQLPDIGKITVDEIQEAFLENKKVKLDVLRLDKIHPVISGNKWFKLKYHVNNYASGKYKGIITFGGAWSNHIVATACLCYLQKINCVGIIRGEKPPQLSPSLLDAMNYNMELKFIPRAIYRKKNDENFLTSIQTEFPHYYFIPEGGAGRDGEKGAGEILELVPNNNYTHIICAVGTGTMFNGLTQASLADQEVKGVVVLKGWNELRDRNLLYEYHFGGYANYNETLLNFMNELYRQTKIPTDFVYTGKLAYAVYDLIKKDQFPVESKILMIHSGGLQGNNSLQKGSLIF